MKKIADLFFTFFFLGLVTFGGGIAMLPFIKRQALNKGWIQENEWQGIVTLAQLSPGAIAVNVANVIGYKVKKYQGSLVAILGMITPPIIVITLFAFGLQTYLTIPLVLKALDGMLIIVFLLFVRAVFDLGKLAWQSWWLVPMSLFSFSLTYWQWLSPVWVMIIATVFSLALTLSRRRQK